MSLSLLVAILFLLDFLKQTQTIRAEKFIHPEKFSELGNAHSQNSSRGSRSGGRHCCAGYACWAHISLL
jgi:hypothetical protein